MTELITRSGAWLLQQTATFPDTVIVKAVAAERGWFEMLTGIASGVTAVLLLVLTTILAGASLAMWRTFKKTRGLLERLYTDLAPLRVHATNVADNVDYITSSIRQDVQQVNATIASANRRLQQAVELTEKRLNEFNALLEVVQQEAEQAFVSTASVVRGVRTGAAAFGNDDIHDDIDDDDIDDDEDEAADIGEGGGDDGDDNETDEDAIGRGGGGHPAGSLGQPSARPRVRPARRRRG